MGPLAVAWASLRRGPAEWPRGLTTLCVLFEPLRGGCVSCSHRQ